jgi:hypothetical protein
MWAHPTADNIATVDATEESAAVLRRARERRGNDGDVMTDPMA